MMDCKCGKIIITVYG